MSHPAEVENLAMHPNDEHGHHHPDAAPEGEPGSSSGCGSSGSPGCDGHGGCGSGGGCGGHAVDTVPHLDTRIIDPRIRQSAIFGVLIGMPPGAQVAIVTDYDPEPIASLIEERLPGAFSMVTEQAERGAWQVSFARQ